MGKSWLIITYIFLSDLTHISGHVQVFSPENYAHPKKILQKCPEAGHVDVVTWIIPRRLRENGSHRDERFEFGLKQAHLHCDDQTEFNINVNSTRAKFFTSTGYFRRGSHYYPPQSYCVLRITDHRITIRACIPRCGKGDPCIPKCCPVGWVIARDLRQSMHIEPMCVPQQNHWLPYFYRKRNSSDSIYELDVVEDIQPYYIEGFPKCRHDRQIYATHSRSTKLFLYDIVVLDTGQVLFRRRGSTHWRERKSSDFCIDGLLEMGETSLFVRQWSNKIMFKCYKPRDVYERNRDGILKVMCAFRFITSFLLLVTVLVYVILWKEQNIHGWTIASFCFCAGVEHAFDGFAFGLIFWNVQFIATTGCFLMSVAHHYFNIATYIWMTILSYDMWATMGSMVPLSHRSRGGKKFIIYCLFGFGIPVMMISVFVLIDVEAIESTNIIRPEYGRHICQVSYSAYLYYLVSIDLLLYLCNLTFSCLCMRTLFCLEQEDMRTHNNSRTRKKKRQFRLLGKLFLIMGSSLLVELVAEFIPGSIAAWIRLVLTVVHCFRDFIIFWIFTCTKKVRKQLGRGFSRISSSNNNK